MAEVADYHAILARAIARLGHDSFEARGAIYDRARTDQLKRLMAADPPLSDDDFTREQDALLEAIRKIEFEDVAAARLANSWRARSLQETSLDVSPAKLEPSRLRRLEREPSARPASDRREGNGVERVRPERAPPRPAHDRLERLRPELIRPERDNFERDTFERDRVEGSRIEPDSEAPVSNKLGQGRLDRRAEQSVLEPRVSEPMVEPVPERMPERVLGRVAGAQSRPAQGGAVAALGASPLPVDSTQDPTGFVSRTIFSFRPILQQSKNRSEQDSLEEEELPPPSRLEENAFEHDQLEHDQLERVRPEQVRPEPVRPDYAQPERGRILEHQPQPSDPEPTPARAQRRPYVRTIAGRMVLALALLGAGVFFFLQTDLLSSWFDKREPPQTESNELTESIPAPAVEAKEPAQRAVLFEEDPTNPVGKSTDGTALWRIRAVPGAPDSKQTNEVTLDVAIPERELALTVTIRPDSDKSAISHLVEFQFAPTKTWPADAIANVVGVLVKKDEQSRGEALAGQVIKIAPGAFLLGLSGLGTDVQENVRLLKAGQWIDIPILHSNGTRTVLAIEKGEIGASALDQIFDDGAGKPGQSLSEPAPKQEPG